MTFQINDGVGGAWGGRGLGPNVATPPMRRSRFDLMFCFQDHEHATFDDILGEFELSVVPNMMMLLRQVG